MIISISGGVAIPSGVFREYEKTTALTNQAINIAGGAKVGYYGKFEIKYLFSKHTGVIGMLYSSINKASSPKEFELFYEQPESVPALGGGYYRHLNNYDITNWKTFGLLTGMYRAERFYFLNFNFKLSVGIQGVKSPETKVDENDAVRWGGSISSTNTTQTFQPSITSYNFMANVGIDISLNISKRFRFKIGWDEFVSQALFKGNQTSVSDYIYNYNGTSEHKETEQNVAFSKNIYLTCFNAGLSYVIK